MKKRVCGIVLILVIAFACSFATISCTSYQPEFFYEAHGTVNFVEEYARTISFEAVKTQNEQAIYVFDEKLSHEAKDEFVRHANQLLDYLDPAPRLIYFVSRFLQTVVDNDRIYIRYNGDLDEIDLITATLMRLTSNSVNYGLLYGTSSLIAIQLGWYDYSPMTQARTFEYVATSAYILDMEFPQFSSNSATEDEIMYTKSAAHHFTQYISLHYGLDFLFELANSRANSLYDRRLTTPQPTPDFDQQLFDLKQEWLEYNGQTVLAQTLTPPNGIYFTAHLYKISFIVETQWTNFYFQDNFYEIYLDTPLEFYPELKGFIQLCMDEQKQVREFFDHDGGNLIKPNCYFLMVFGEEEFGQRMDSNIAGLATTQQNLYVRTSFAFLHEYTHSLTFQLLNLTAVSWMAEGIAQYCDNLYSSLRKEWEIIKLEDRSDDEFIRLWIYSYLQYVEEGEINLFDFMDMYSYLSALHGREDFDNYRQGSSLTKYLIDEYGKEKYFELYRSGGNFETVLDKSSQTIHDEWNDFLTAKFAGV